MANGETTITYRLIPASNGWQVEMENVRRQEEQTAREEKVREEKQAETAEKQRKRDAELEEKARREKEEAVRGASTPAATTSNGPSSGGGKYVPMSRRDPSAGAPPPVSPQFAKIQIAGGQITFSIGDSCVERSL